VQLANLLSVFRSKAPRDANATTNQTHKMTHLTYLTAATRLFPSVAATVDNRGADSGKQYANFRGMSGCRNLLVIIAVHLEAIQDNPAAVGSK